MNRTDFLAGTKCTTMAWYQARQESPLLDDAARFRMEQGREVEELARRLFPDGTLVRGHNAPAILETQRLISRDATTTVFAATFNSGPFTAKADVLTRNGAGWDVTEVGSGFSESTEYVDDLAYTAMVLRRGGVPVKKSALLLLSREYRRGDPVDKLFTRLDKTRDVDVRSKAFDERADAIAEAVLVERVPQAVLISACRTCEFFKTLCLGARCAHSVLELPRLHHTKFAKLCAAGLVDIRDVPADLALTELQQRVKIAAASGELFVAPGLADALTPIEWPCHYLDFETVASTLPLYDAHGCHHQVLTQFSVHHRDGVDAAPRHSEFLADPKEEQERLLAERLLEVLGTGGSIIVYTHFEKVRVKVLMDQFPDLADSLRAILTRFVDLQRIIKDHVYHPAFAGSFSLKKVVPALVPGVSYDALPVADGDNAIAVFARMARGELADTAEARRQLLAYCEMDTFVMVKLHEILLAMTMSPSTTSVMPPPPTHNAHRLLVNLRDHLARHDKPIAFLFGAGTSCSVQVPCATNPNARRPLIPAVDGLTALCEAAAFDLGAKYQASWTQMRDECLARIMREGVDLGETQGPPCGTNVVYINV